MDWSLLIIILSIIFVGLALWDLITRRQFSLVMKVLWMIIIILLPIIGVSLYYFQISFYYKKRQSGIKSKM